MKSNRYIFLFLILALASCKRETPDRPSVNEDRIIHVSGLSTDSPLFKVVSTKAETTDILRAEDVPWMQGSLRHGLDIRYSNINRDGSHNTDNESVAILKWKGTRNAVTGRGDYSFLYKGRDNVPAEWYDNGPHYFEGQYVPSELLVGNGHTMAVSDLLTDQHDESDYEYFVDSEGVETTTGSIGNYTLLSHYIGMPPSWTASATVDQILIPFKHRLSRVIVYVLIDDQLVDSNGNTATLKGYALDGEGKDNPVSTSFRFANVQVLENVEEVPAKDGAHSDHYIPGWTEARRVIPHFVEEFRSSVNLKDESSVPDDAAQKYHDAADGFFIVYTSKRDEKKLHPRDEGWFAAHKNFVDNGEAKSAYYQQKYSIVPVYDIIVRPTYVTVDDVMYDELGYYNNDNTINNAVVRDLAALKNSIEFEMTLSNDLIYTKKFEFDLNANQQTVVYISIDRESVDYDSSSSEPWVDTAVRDGYYGVDNDLGHNMSRVGSSWHRALTYCVSDPSGRDVTDGNSYSDSEVDRDVDFGQYTTDSDRWIDEFVKATEGGSRQGDYFVLDRDIVIPSGKLPANFVFTGHLDARNHTISIGASGRTCLFDGLNGTYDGDMGQYNIHRENGKLVPVKGYRAELYNITVAGGNMFADEAVPTGYIYNCFDDSHTAPDNPIDNPVSIPEY